MLQLMLLLPSACANSPPDDGFMTVSECVDVCRESALAVCKARQRVNWVLDLSRPYSPQQ